MRVTRVYPQDEINSNSMNHPEYCSCFSRIRRRPNNLIAILLTMFVCCAILIPLIFTLNKYRDNQLSTMNTTWNVTESMEYSSTMTSDELNNTTGNNSLVIVNSTLGV